MGTDSRSLLQAQKGELLSAVLDRAARRRRRARAADLRGEVLDGGERLRIIDTFVKVLEGAYCHLPQKRSAYALNPIQALRLLARRAGELSDAEFHLAITSIVTGLRDAHTRYSGPLPLQGQVAVLPFLVEQFGPFDQPTFIVSKVSGRRLVKNPRFVPKVTLETWNGIPMARAVEIYADRETGGRPDARRARALESLTFRDLEYGPPPDELWVDVGFRTLRGARDEVRIPWRVVDPRRAPSGHQPGSRASRFIGADPSGERVRRAKKLMFSGSMWAAERTEQAKAYKTAWIPTDLPDVLAARKMTVRGVGPIGYLRVWSFDVDDDDAFVEEVARLLDLLPKTGLIVDLRSNPGGLIWAAERMLQVFTSRRITPLRFSLVATTVTRDMAASPFNQLELGAWSPSLDMALLTGDAYSQPLPLTDPSWFEGIPQLYPDNKVVCVVDPNTYSSGDIFAAGFVDHKIGPLVCVGEATGAGGANVWTDVDLRQALEDTPYKLSPLPDGVRYTVAIRRAIRNGDADGVPIEDLGVPGIPYAFTRDDLLYDNRDLIAFCARQIPA